VRQSTALLAEAVTVRYREGVSHGFLVLRTLDGKSIADGELTQVARDDRVTSQMRFRFKRGSIYEETTVFSQRDTFRLLSHRVLQKGPEFKRPMETSIDPTAGQVTVRYTDDDSKKKILTQRPELPPDLANGMLFTLLKNVQLASPKRQFHTWQPRQSREWSNLRSLHKARKHSRLAATGTKRCTTS